MAISMLTSFSSLRLAPDVVSFCTAISCCADMWPQALQLLQLRSRHTRLALDVFVVARPCHRVSFSNSRAETAMADRKLVSCMGYSFRLAARQGRHSIAWHLWYGLYSLNEELNAKCINPDHAPPAKQLCLFSALGLDRQEQSEDPDGVTATLESTMGRQCFDQSTQTEVQMLSMQEVNSIMDRVQQSLVEKLTPFLCPDRGNPASEEQPDLPQDPLATRATSQRPQDIPRDPVGTMAGTSADVESSIDRACAAELAASRQEVQRETRQAEKRQRRELRRRELEKRAGLT
eukprot:Skav224475  [mRNA]  locus=scaffold1302:571120:573577:- [translate_table: standard]